MSAAVPFCDDTDATRRRGVSRIGGYVLALFPVVAFFNFLTLVDFAGIPIHPSDVLIVVGACLFLVDVATQPRVSRNEIVTFGLICAVAMAMLATVVAIAGDAINGASLARFLEVLIWGLLASRFLRNYGIYLKFLRNVGLFGAAIGVASIVQFILTPGLQRIAGLFGSGTGNGVAGIGDGGFNEIGAFCTVSALIGFVLAGTRTNGQHGAVWLRVLSILAVAGLAFTQSRSAMLAGLVVVVSWWGSGVVRAVFRAGRIRRIRMRNVIWIVALFGFGGYVIANIALINRVASTFAVGSSAYLSSITRFRLWSDALHTTIFGSRGVMGALFGYGNAFVSESFNMPTFDSFFLDKIVAFGVVGLATIVMFYVFPVVSVLRKRRMNGVARGVGRVVGMTGLAAVVVSATGNVLVDPTFGAMVVIVLYGGAACVSHVAVMRR